MRARLLSVLPNHVSCFTTIMGSFLYVKDMKKSNGGNAVIDCCKTKGVPAVELYNPKSLEYQIEFDAFPDNALPLSKGHYEEQCECVMFPENSDQNEWVLFIETKYAEKLESAKNPQYRYPEKMVEQIRKTVKYFRDKNILSPNKVVYAIISFPFIEEGFESWSFPIKKKDGTLESVEDILFNDKIHIRATNHAILKNKSQILLGEM